MASVICYVKIRNVMPIKLKENNKIRVLRVSAHLLILLFTLYFFKLSLGFGLDFEFGFWLGLEHQFSIGTARRNFLVCYFFIAKLYGTGCYQCRSTEYVSFMLFEFEGQYPFQIASRPFFFLVFVEFGCKILKFLHKQYVNVLFIFIY